MNAILTRLRNRKDEVEEALHCIALSTDDLRSLENDCELFCPGLSSKSPEQILECLFSEEDFVGLFIFDVVRFKSLAESTIFVLLLYILGFEFLSRFLVSSVVDVWDVVLDLI